MENLNVTTITNISYKAISLAHIFSAANCILLLSQHIIQHKAQELHMECKWCYKNKNTDRRLFPLSVINIKYHNRFCLEG